MKGKPVDVWFFDSSQVRRPRRGIYSPYKVFIYTAIYRAITRHDIAECCWILRLLPRMTVIDPYVTFRFIMIMIHTTGDQAINSNFIVYLEALLSKLEMAKPDIFMEFLTYFVSNNRINDARNLFSQRYKFMSYLYHRKLPLINVNLGCYELMFNYLDWKASISEQCDNKFDVSIQGWLVNAMSYLKQTGTNHELFVMCVIHVLTFYKFIKKAYLIVSEFQRNNPDNFAAQLLLHNLIKSLNNRTPKRQRTDSSYYASAISSEEEQVREANRLKDLESLNNFATDEDEEVFNFQHYPLVTDRKRVFDNLRRLDYGCDEVLELSVSLSDRLDAFRLLMDSLERIPEMRRPSRWLLLLDMLNQILISGDAVLIEGTRKLWQKRYHRHWSLDTILALAADQPDSKVKHRKVIKKVLFTLISEFDPIEETPVEDEECEHATPDDDYYDLDCKEE